MSEFFFHSESSKKVREETRKRAAYADGQISPNMKDLMDQSRRLFEIRAFDIADDAPLEEIDRIFNECIEEVPGAQEAFETWDQMFKSAKVD